MEDNLADRGMSGDRPVAPPPRSAAKGVEGSDDEQRVDALLAELRAAGDLFAGMDLDGVEPSIPFDPSWPAEREDG
jgi:hypothetical protein